MSTRIMSACWSLPMSPSQKIVLISLADQANDEGICWPSIQSICERTSLAERTVQTVLNKLEAMGVLLRRHRYRQSTVYRVDAEGFRPLSEDGNSDDSGGAGAAGPDIGGDIPEGDDLPRTSCGATDAGQESYPADDGNVPRKSLQSTPQQMHPEPSKKTFKDNHQPRAGARVREGPADPGLLNGQGPAFELPPDVPPDEWRAYMASRKANGVVTTNDAKRELVRQLRELVGQGHDAAEVLTTAMLGGWKRLYDPTPPGQKRSPETDISAAKRRLQERERQRMASAG